jgi:asparagine synthase (glutamine-hydrolysing)
MCGILGWVGHRLEPDRGADFRSALNLLAHRGPDDSGQWQDEEVLLGHRRLAVLDLSAAGHQPMVHPESGAVIVFNGEIYNYLELRRELESLGHRFRSSSDTEVLLAAYLQWGRACLPRFNGMWAFAIWMPGERKLFFARDRFGVKPFYFRVGSEGFAFASEPKALLKLFPAHKRVNRQALCDFLADGRLYYRGRSFYEGVHVLAPAHYGEFSAETERLSTSRYWDYPSEPVSAGNSDSVEELTGLLDDAVRLRLRSDVPVGLTLSGGLDSTAVLAGAMRAREDPLVCFTSVYGGAERGEADWAARAGDAYRIKPREVIAPQHHWEETLGKIAWHMDGPGYSPAVYPLWFIMEKARSSGVPVLLEGQGADELFGGYPWHAAIALTTRLGSVFSRSSTEGVKDLIASMRGSVHAFTLRWIGLWLIREAFPALVDWNRDRVGALGALRPELLECRDTEPMRPPAAQWMEPLTSRLLLDHASEILPGLLHYGDAISMAHGVESRLPFLDYRLVEFAFSRADAFKVRSGRTKWLLREYLRRADQQRIAERRDKQGYPTPVERWLAEDDGAIAREVLMTPNARISEYCNPVQMERLIRHHARGRRGAGNHLYRLVSTELWLRSCLAG